MHLQNAHFYLTCSRLPSIAFCNTVLVLYYSKVYFRMACCFWNTKDVVHLILHRWCASYMLVRSAILELTSSPYFVRDAKIFIRKCWRPLISPLLFPKNRSDIEKLALIPLIKWKYGFSPVDTHHFTVKHIGLVIVCRLRYWLYRNFWFLCIYTRMFAILLN